MKKKINWKVLSFNYVDENNEFPFVYQKMQELIGHHHEIYERLGFKICNHQDKGQRQLTKNLPKSTIF